jgi:two-component system response regulator VicR
LILKKFYVKIIYRGEIMKKILVVDDEQSIVDILKFNLEKNGFEVVTAYAGDTGYEMAMTENPDLILLDVMLPEMDGFEVCKKIRQTSSVPIIMLTARIDEIDKVLGLELGADDYMTKPFGVRELVARVKANLRRTVSEEKSKENSAILTFGNLAIDTEKFGVTKNGTSVELTLREYELLMYLVNQGEKIVSRETLLEKVWGYEYYGDVRTVDVTVSRLREKIEDNPAEPSFIITKRGFGYFFKTNQ